jgi:hypothetical protein
MTNNQPYPEEFKIEAVKQSRERHRRGKERLPGSCAWKDTPIRALFTRQRCVRCWTAAWLMPQFDDGGVHRAPGT